MLLLGYSSRTEAKEARTFVRVLRRCPRRGCGEHNYFMAHRDPGSRWIRIKCDCGMEWRGRYRKDEWT